MTDEKKKKWGKLGDIANRAAGLAKKDPAGPEPETDAVPDPNAPEPGTPPESGTTPPEPAMVMEPDGPLPDRSPSEPEAPAAAVPPPSPAATSSQWSRFKARVIRAWPPVRKGWEQLLGALKWARVGYYDPALAKKAKSQAAAAKHKKAEAAETKVAEPPTRRTLGDIQPVKIYLNPADLPKDRAELFR